MEAFSEANVIVDRMLVEYFRTPEEEREQLPGTEAVKLAWNLIHQELENVENSELAEAFEAQPVENQHPLTVRLTHLMRRNDELAGTLRRLLDLYLQQLYAGTIDVKQQVSEISNASGVIKGGSVIGINIDSMGD